MRHLQKIRQRVFTILAILGVICVGFLVYLLWPGSSVGAQKEQAANLKQQYNALSREVEPLNGIEGKLMQTRTDIKNLYKDAVPNRASEISLRLEKISQAVGGQSQGVRYNSKTQDKMLFVIDQVALSSQQSGIVTLQIKLHTFLKES